MSGVPDTALNRELLAGADRRESLRQVLLTLPGLVLIGLLLIVPLLWLVILSFVGDAGHFSFENYARLLSPLYLKVISTTLEISIVTTFLCAVLGYPVAYLMSQLPKRLAALCMIAVILPFWTSVLVRTYAWLVLLQRNGLINQLLVATGVIDEPVTLVHNWLGTTVGMVHVMLPFMILPLYSAMRAIDPSYLKAAASCGAGPARGFRNVFFPLTRDALFSGIILVFVLCLGFYLTPSLLGGGKVLLISMEIESSVREYGNWGAASAPGVLVILVTFAFLGVMRKALRVGDGREGR